MTKIIISTLAATIALSSASTSFAAPKQGTTSFQQCMANLQASGRNFGGNSEDNGMTRHDEMAARCTEQLYGKHHGQPR